MCGDEPDRTGLGYRWAAVRRVRTEGTIVLRRSSAFAQRGACAACGAPLFIRYECEAHTDWAALYAFQAHIRLVSPHAASTPDPERAGVSPGTERAARANAEGHAAAVEVPGHHIHCGAARRDFGDNLHQHASWEPWDLDPCAPPPLGSAGEAEQALALVCYACFLPVGASAGPSGTAWLERVLHGARADARAQAEGGTAAGVPASDRDAEAPQQSPLACACAVPTLRHPFRPMRAG
eukprot:CAMPEP_0205999562 /NCGR_PEP_ID=MMETSP1464-20131121/926_1 /ASSEMBLY_ACC=CAM_ASM_001124 /TAXON_ID=119497 /ORGANISM="Exanthemachrysis gayraliae, Strain RCC1523" /LENGTH=236 /DNA_ID=CAMNT_0053372769 /DNA_START=43 /DNA_END=753 /DNA_ORIENTATION=-